MTATDEGTVKRSSTLRAGDWVEVRSKEEILSTLDMNGRLDGLPFMPEMFRSCGKRFRVFKRAHKTCDTVTKTGGRSLTQAVHLDELRCDGSAHGGCQAGCLLFWKDAWLRKLDGARLSGQAGAPGTRMVCTEAAVMRATTNTEEGSCVTGGPTYMCQATLLPTYTTLLSRWDIRQYWEDLRSRNVSIHNMVGPVSFAIVERLVNCSRVSGRVLRWIYDSVMRILGGQPYPRHRGRIPSGCRTPSQQHNLRPGDWARVRDFEAILETLDENNRNRGMYFDAEEVPFCGKTHQVKARVSRIIDERTGKMIQFKSESLILDGVYCQARYSDKRLFCPRAIYPLWREVWLEPVDDPNTSRTRA